MSGQAVEADRRGKESTGDFGAAHAGDSLDEAEKLPVR